MKPPTIKPEATLRAVAICRAISEQDDRTAQVLAEDVAADETAEILLAMAALVDSTLEATKTAAQPFYRNLQRAVQRGLAQQTGTT